MTHPNHGDANGNCPDCVDPETGRKPILAECATCAKPLTEDDGTPCSSGCGFAYCFACFGEADPEREVCDGCYASEKRDLADERRRGHVALGLAPPCSECGRPTDNVGSGTCDACHAKAGAE